MQGGALDRYDAQDVAREFQRVRTTGQLLVGLSVPLTVLAIVFGMHSVVASLPTLYRFLFFGVAVAAFLFCLFLNNIIDSPRPLRRPGLTGPQPSVAAQVASVATVLLTIPFSVLLLGFAFRLALGGTVVDYLVFLAIAAAMWAIFFPRRARFVEWVRMRTEGRG
jgi:hypothetical protein